MCGNSAAVLVILTVCGNYESVWYRLHCVETSDVVDVELNSKDSKKRKILFKNLILQLSLGFCSVWLVACPLPKVFSKFKISLIYNSFEVLSFNILFFVTVENKITCFNITN